MNIRAKSMSAYSAPAPNPSIERTASGLRPTAAAHVER